MTLAYPFPHHARHFPHEDARPDRSQSATTSNTSKDSSSTTMTPILQHQETLAAYAGARPDTPYPDAPDLIATSSNSSPSSSSGSGSSPVTTFARTPASFAATTQLWPANAKTRHDHRRHSYEPPRQAYTPAATASVKGKESALHGDTAPSTGHPRMLASSEGGPAKCKFAKAGCPFVGLPAEVAAHESAYCTPLYTQLAHYKTLARHCSAFHGGNPTTFSPEDALALSSRQQDTITAQTERIARLQSDLDKAQRQLEEEKRLRHERLRRANERVMELMSQSELGEGKVEVYKVQLHAERELNEKLEEELESLRGQMSVHANGAEDAGMPPLRDSAVHASSSSRPRRSGLLRQHGASSSSSNKRTRASEYDDSTLADHQKRSRREEELSSDV